MTTGANRQWHQAPLVHGFYSAVTARLIVHYEGTTGLVTTGYLVEDLVNDEPLAMGAHTVSTPMVLALARLDAELLELHDLATSFLSPF